MLFASQSTKPVFQELRFGSEVVYLVFFRPSCLESVSFPRLRCLSDNVSSVLLITVITTLL